MGEYLVHVLTIIGIYCILAVSLNIALGFTGLLNLGHIALFGIGAYTSAILTKQGVPFVIAFVAAGVISSVFGTLLVVITNRLKGDYLALATLGFNLIVLVVLLNWFSLTNGPLGIAGIPRVQIIGYTVKRGIEFLLLTGVVSVVSVASMYRLTSSRYGRVLEAVRDDAVGASALGKNIFKIKCQAMAVSAFFAGIAGSLFAHFIGYIDPYSFYIHDIIICLTIVIVGGLASIRGSIIAAFLITAIPEALRFLDVPLAITGAIRTCIYASILLLILLLRPRGLFGKVDLE